MLGLRAARRGFSSMPVKVRGGVEQLISYGPGGRSSVSGLTCSVFGSTGFVGRYLVSRLGKSGGQCVVAYRGDELLARHLRPLGDLGQVVPLFYSLKDFDSIKDVTAGSHVAVNLVGRDFETSNFSFNEVHVEGPRRIARSCRENGVNRFIHVSALGASHDSPSAFLRSKAAGEEAVREEFPDVTIIRPASIFGAEDRFLTRIAYLNLNPFLPGTPVVKNGLQSVQPVYAGDVAQGMINILKDNSTMGKTYEFIGPRKYTYAQLVQYYSEICHRPASMLNSELVLKAFARVMEMWPPVPVICREDIVRMKIDEVASKGSLGLEQLGVKPTPLESAILTIWRSFRPALYIDEPLPEHNAAQLPKN